MADELAALDATAQAERVSRREVSPRELVEAAIERIEKVDPRIHAVITPLYEKARAAAASDALPRGPFRGVPFLLKDLGCASAGDPLHNGMRVLRDVGFRAPGDTYLARRFRRAGLVFLGKTNTPELGLTATTEPLAYGPTRNPWDPTRSAGGSSGGSAAAVAAGLVPAAHANDGGGSIRIPASACGLVGLKPTRGRVSLGPDVGESWHGLAIEGVVTRSVRDTAAFLDVMAGPEPGDPYVAPPPERPWRDALARPPGRLRIGLLDRTPAGDPPLHAECATAVRDAARLLESLGHAVEQGAPAAIDDPELSPRFRTLLGAHTAATLGMIGAALGRAIGPQDVEPWTWTLAELGHATSAEAYLDTGEWMNRYSRAMAAWWSEGFDLLLTPTLAAPPPALGTLVAAPEAPLAYWDRLMQYIPFTPPANLTGQPAISLPLHWSEAGLPIGVQLVAAYGREDLLLCVAAQLEEARPWRGRRPPIHA